MSKFNVDIAREIERLCKNGGSVIDAICHWCEENGVDVETIASIVKKDAVLKARIQIEAEELRILRPSARLPI